MNPSFIESVCFKNGDFQLLEYHQARMNRTFNYFYPGCQPYKLRQVLPKLKLEGTHKIRIVYDQENLEVELHEYAMRKIESLQIAHGNHINYDYKSEDRSEINQLVRHSTADDILIAKDGCLTDSSYANLAFWDGEKWFTPKEPLLPGVKRAFLIKQGLIHEKKIRIEDINYYEKLCFINAMIDLEELTLPIYLIN